MTTAELAPPPVDVVHRSLLPVHVIGHGRSGTSVFIRLVRKYLRVAFGTESQFIIRFHQRLAHYGDLSEASNQSRLVNDLCEERWFRRCYKRFEFTTTPDAILADITEPTYAGVLDATFRQLAKHMDMPRWGDKTPEYLHHLPTLHSLFPQAKFIHVVRDGRDVALSGFEMPFGERNIFVAAQDWLESTQKIEAFRQTIPEEQFHEVRYEDFLTDPTAEFARLIEFLEIDDEHGRLIDHIDQSISDDLMHGNFDKWRRKMSPGQITRFDQLATDQLRRYGYDSSVEAPRQPSSVESAYWWIDNKVRRVCDAGHLRDMVYRAGLRLKRGS